MIDIRLGHECGLRMRKNAKEHNPPKGSMYMFIEFGRLGCKHVIYLGDVCVLANKFMCLIYEGSIGEVHMMHNHYHFGSSMLSMLEILCICLLLNFKTHPPGPMLIATKSWP